jgi:FMN phosphatase YigB (HAD superfamily)
MMEGKAAQSGKRRLESLKGIIFLLDDVLLDRQDWLVPAISYAAVKLGMDSDRVAVLSDDYINQHGRADSGIYNHILLGCGQSDSVMNIRAFSAWVNRYSPTNNSLYMLPGVAEALSVLNINYELALLAEGSAEAQRAKVLALHGAAIFQHIVFADEIDGMKSRLPNLRGLNALQKRMQSRVTETLLVACHPRRHFAEPGKLGYLTARCLTGDYARLDYEHGGSEADFNLSSAARLPELLVSTGEQQVSMRIGENSGNAHFGNKAHA